MDDLPDPFTPPDCDLRGFDWMALLGARLFKSTFYRKARKDPRAGLAGIKLWWEAMLQTPAGSLPNDDDELCELADFGEDIKTWQRHREVALYGWVLCSDGRLYHKTVAEQVVIAWEKKLKANETREGWKERKRRQRDTHNGHDDPPSGNDVPRDVHRDNGVTSNEKSQETNRSNSVTSNVTRLDVHRDVPVMSRGCLVRADKTRQDKTVQGESPNGLSPLDRTEKTTARARGPGADAPPGASLPPEDRPVDPEHVRQELAKLTAQLTGRPRYEIQEQTMTPEEQIRALGGT